MAMNRVSGKEISVPAFQHLTEEAIVRVQYWDAICKEGYFVVSFGIQGLKGKEWQTLVTGDQPVVKITSDYPKSGEIFLPVYLGKARRIRTTTAFIGEGKEPSLHYQAEMKILP